MRLRNRWTKATFWTDGALLRWERDKRFFYKSLWACAEDSCCIEDDMFEVKMTAWPSPHDADMTVERMEAWRDEFIEDGKLIPYTNGEPGRRYLYLPDMAKHEMPRNPQRPDLPLPEWVTYEVKGVGRDARVKYEHTFSGIRRPTVETASGNRNTSPVLSCPVLKKDTSSSKPDDDAFDEFWKHYPRKVGKKAARKKFSIAIRDADPSTIISALKAYPFDTRDGLRYVPHPATWLNQGRWEDDIPVTATSAPQEICEYYEREECFGGNGRPLDTCQREGVAFCAAGWTKGGVR